MKSYIFTAAVLLLIAAQKCKRESKAAIPACIQQRIDAIKKEPKWNPAAQVDLYRYNGKEVYYFSSNCCDQYNQVTDANCTTICAPSGGITGRGDRQCDDFNEKAQFIRTIWKDER
ncbi:MAG TPA: hypothetical protein VHK91_15065 [Flavisolibacter sp.]|nr:hypothetical protein [Flavisolibacter sp.]